MLLVDINCCPKLSTSSEMVRDYAKADFAAIRSSISEIDWFDELTPLNAQESWDKFKVILEETVNKSIPLKPRRGSVRPMWMNQNIIRLIRKKRRLWNWYQTTREYAELVSFKNVQKLVNSTIRNAKRNLERKLAKNVKKNPKAFYSYLNKQSKSRSSVGPLKHNDKTVSDDPGMADVLNKFFASVFTKENVTTMPVPEQVFDGDAPVKNAHICPECIVAKIKKLKPGSAPGPDKIPAKILIELKEELAIPLCMIFIKSLKEGVVPADWKLANVAPIFKKGNKDSPGNYRPISLTCILSKIMESLIRDHIMAHLDLYKLIRLSQHGFLQHRSTVTNLLEYLDKITELIDSGANVDVFYLDFAKAFDKVPHQRLLAKLRGHGITGLITGWIENWLSDRLQRVVLNGCFSSWLPVTSGVPQGSVLGPILFIIYINDIDLAVATSSIFLFKFADDTKGIKEIKGESCARELQEALNNLFAWSEEWQMLFNADKCHIIHLGRTNPNFPYSINGTGLVVVEEEKDLGVLIHKSCTPSSQVAKAAKKANSVLGQLMRAVSYRDRFTYIRLYKEFVRPHLEYAVQTWCPWLQRDIDLLEDVQKRAVRAVSGINGSYAEKLSTLNLPSLTARRERGDMIQTFKIVNQIDNVDPKNYFQFSATQHNHATRQGAFIEAALPHQDNVPIPTTNLVVQNGNLDLRRNFFTHRVVNKWNNLDQSVKTATGLNEFKNKYDAKKD